MAHSLRTILRRTGKHSAVVSLSPMGMHSIRWLFLFLCCCCWCSTVVIMQILPRCDYKTQLKCVFWKGRKICECRPIYLNKTFRHCPRQMKYMCKEFEHGPDCRCYKVK